MSVNYYAASTNADFVFEKMPGAIINHEDKRFEIHLAKTTSWLKPLFQSNKEFSDWKEMSAYLMENEDALNIVDEYGVIYRTKDFLNMIKKQNDEESSSFSVFPEMQTDPMYYKDSDGYEWCKAGFS